MMFKVLTDSTSDLRIEDREKYNIDYFKMVFTLENQTYEASLDWDKINPEDYYNSMKKGNRSITGLVIGDEFISKFEKYLSNGFDVLYIACSSKLSGSYNSSLMFIEELKSKYPERKIIAFDSLRSNYAEGLMAIEAAKASKEGKSIEETIEYLKKYRLNFQTFATVGSLEYLRKAGRVKASTAFFGNLLGVKPILVGDKTGYNTAFKKVKGRKKSLDELVLLVCKRMINPSENVLYIEHASCLEDAKYIANKVKDFICPKEIVITCLGPIIGASTGPDTITLNFFGQSVEDIGD